MASTRISSLDTGKESEATASTSTILTSTGTQRSGDIENLDRGTRLVLTKLDDVVAELHSIGSEIRSYRERALEPMKKSIHTESRLIEEVTNKVAELTGGKIIAANYVLKDEENQPITDIDGMVAGVWEGQEVIVFVEAKHHVEVTNAARTALDQLDKVLRYWDELRAGVLKEWIEDEDMHKVEAHKDLQVLEYGNRPVLIAIGARGYSESEKRYFRRLRRSIILLTGDPTHKFILMDSQPESPVLSFSSSVGAM